MGIHVGNVHVGSMHRKSSGIIPKHGHDDKRVLPLHEQIDTQDTVVGLTTAVLATSPDIVPLGNPHGGGRNSGH